MSRPVFLKLGGSVLTDKAKEGTFRKAVTRRLLSELAKADVPVVLFHGAGSFGHPPAERWGLGTRAVTPERLDAISETLAAVIRLHAQVLTLAQDNGLHPVSVPLHMLARSEAGALEGVPVRRIQALLEEGFTPVLHGTVVRDDALGWRVVSADELMAELAPDLQPRLAVFTTDVDGVEHEGRVLETVQDVQVVLDRGGDGADVTGRMQAKVRHGLSVAETCPVLVLNGTVRGRLLDALKGKRVLATRLGA